MLALSGVKRHNHVNRKGARSKARTIMWLARYRRHMKLKLLAQRPHKNYDFAYVRDLPKHLQRMAAFWEYARESKDLRDLAESLSKALLKDQDISEIRNRYFTILDVEEAALITGSTFFPAFSFIEQLVFGLPGRLRTSYQFGISGINCLPLKESLSFIMQLPGPLPKHYTMHAIFIPWDRTDSELTDMFRELLQGMRPHNQPQPRRAGRKGISSSVSPIDMLNQLVAFRVSREGIPFDEAAEFAGYKLYQTEKGWRSAALAAAKRIGDMGRVAFFEKQRQTQTTDINWEGIYFRGRL
jgi:hypothetical protein